MTVGHLSFQDGLPNSFMVVKWLFVALPMCFEVTTLNNDCQLFIYPIPVLHILLYFAVNLTAECCGLQPPNELMLYSLESGRGKQLIGHNTQVPWMFLEFLLQFCIDFNSRFI